MLNPESMLTLIEKLIREVEPTTQNRLHLCHFEDRLQCKPANHTSEKHPVFFSFTFDYATQGFTNHEWDNLLHKLFCFYKESNPCPTPQKL